MQLFYSSDISPDSDVYILSEEESKHCIRVLRMNRGDRFHITDGKGNLFMTEIVEADPKHCHVTILEHMLEFEKRSYGLWLAVAPTKNSDRYEWFVEKVTEFGIDRITPLLTSHSERKGIKTERLEKIATSAMKQSLKAYLPHIDPLTDLKTLITTSFEGKKLIAHCNPDETKRSLRDAVNPGENVLILIGPEGDFSPEEVENAYAHGFEGISLGHTRLRTETAAIAAAHAVAFINE